MKNLHFTYDMHIEYSIDVSKCNYTIKCIPLDNLRQKISNINIEMFPESKYCTGSDGLGNRQIYGVNLMPHKTFDFHIEGDAITGLSDCEEKENDNLSMIFAHPHGLNVAGKSIKDFFGKLPVSKELSVYDRAVAIMHELGRSFAYKPLSTNVNTSAEEAFSQGCGVCQDYAHIFISLLHLAGISARYVTGLLIGEGQSHAWVEILSDGKWYGLDPTNDCAVSDSHIKIGVGRDAKDCTINRGIMHGGGLHTQTVTVRVEENDSGLYILDGMRD